MASIHPEDAQTVCTMLALPEVPDDLNAECGLCLELFHRGGHTGPLGTPLLLTILRRFGYDPPQATKIVRRVVDWDQYPPDGTVVVLVQIGPDTYRGVFLGRVSADGTLSVRLDDEVCVREFAATSVQPTFERREPVQLVDPSDAPPAQASIPAPSLPPETLETFPDEEPSVDYSQLQPGSQVWVEDGDDIKTGQFCGLTETGVLVQFANLEPTEFPMGSVIPVPK